jgi:DTW domain-containing protein YfiP
MPTTFDALAGEDRTSEQPAIIRRTAAPAARMAVLFPAAVTSPLRDTLEHYKS